MISQETAYPWQGVVKITVEPEQPAEFTLHIRVPGWARNQLLPSDLYRYLDQSDEPVTLALNGAPLAYEVIQGFAQIRRRWRAGDVVQLNLPMPVRRVVSHEQVKDNLGRVALERGPLVYCVEAVDNGGRIDHIRVSDETEFRTEHRPDLLNGITTIQAQGQGSFTAIPYYAWSHRGPGEMAVWLTRK